MQEFSAAILSNRKILKNSKIFISGDLTKTRFELLSSVKEKLGKTNVWSLQGKIHVKKNNSIHVIYTKEDLDKL